MSQCWRKREGWDAETWLQDMGCHTASGLSAGKGSGAGLPRLRHCPSKRVSLGHLERVEQQARKLLGTWTI